MYNIQVHVPYEKQQNIKYKYGVNHKQNYFHACSSADKIIFFKSIIHCGFF